MENIPIGHATIQLMMNISQNYRVKRTTAEYGMVG